MSYLTKLVMDPTRRETVRLLANPRRIHGELAALPGTENTEQTRLLWRAESYPGRTVLYVHSPEAIDVEQLYSRTGWPSQPPQILDYGQKIGLLAEGQELAFTLSANATKAAADAGAANPKRPELTRGKRVGLISREDQLKWLKRQAERCGFELVSEDEELRIQTRPQARIAKRTDEGARTVTVTIVDFSGRLRITDAEEFRRTLTTGLGKTKAYGLGMLMIAPVRSHG